MFDFERFKPRLTLEEQLTAEAVALRKKAAKLKSGTERECLLQKALQDVTAADMSFCIISAGRQSSH